LLLFNLEIWSKKHEKSSCIIYIDEIDAIDRQRSQGGGAFDGASGESEQTLNQLLVEIDGILSRECQH
jgi:ATP-dependent Zn protease